MTSAIVSATIDEDFPVAGQDNDSQGFRDNFNIIKTGLATANSEITVLQTNGIFKGPLNEETALDNDFNGNVIFNVKTNRVYSATYATSSTGTTVVDFQSGAYQTITMTGNHTIRFENWPEGNEEEDVYAVMRVAFKSDGSVWTIADFISQAAVSVKKEVGFPTPFEVPADDTIIKIIEVWTPDNGVNVFVKYLGEYQQ